MLPNLVDAGLRRRREEEMADRSKEFSWSGRPLTDTRHEVVSKREEEQKPFTNVESRKEELVKKEEQKSYSQAMMTWQGNDGRPQNMVLKVDGSDIDTRRERR